MTASTTLQPSCSYHAEPAGDGSQTMTLAGRLDVNSTGTIWRDALLLLEEEKPDRVVLDMSGVTYCDAAGIALLLALRRQQTSLGGNLTINGLQERFQSLLQMFESADLGGQAIPEPERLSAVAGIGRASLTVWEDVRRLIAFVGELFLAMAEALTHPGRIRWRDVFLTAELAGVNALPIVALLGFLLGLIMAFQSAIPMRQFGADIYVANLIGLSMIRELGPLLTAIILAGRSGSAFAAELGTMKVSEEIDALVTMGLRPVRFLVVPRVLAAVAMTPLLAIFANLFGLIGGAVVMLSLGFSFEIYKHQILSAVTAGDFLGGLFKSVFFGIVVAGIGCLRGLQTKTGASAVGDSTTNAVVSGLVLITVVDGIFAVVFYYLGL
jgi:phospholipid/cholesterol/gamma-HCH transport system permease protein